MNFWTRALIVIAVMNFALVIGSPLILGGVPSPNPLINWFAYDSTADLTQPLSGGVEQNLSQSIDVGGVSADDPLTGLIAPFKILFDLLTGLVAFFNAPIDYMNHLQFPGVFVVIFGVFYYTMLVIGT